MIDFQNASFAKLKPVDPTPILSMIQPMFVQGEQIIASF